MSQKILAAAILVSVFPVAGALAQSTPNEQRARDIYKELIEINTTDTPAGSVTKAAEAMIVKGKNAVTLSVPVAIYRNRFQSVPDKARGAHGDAAFADYLILAGYSRRF